MQQLTEEQIEGIAVAVINWANMLESIYAKDGIHLTRVQILDRAMMAVMEYSNKNNQQMDIKIDWGN